MNAFGMALAVNPQFSEFKHHCRVCKKGFACGRALGGHMRAHGIISDYDDDELFDDEELEQEQGSDWDREADHAPPPNKRMYALRANPNRRRTCENCGKEFSSWKSFLEHGKCVTNDVDDSVVFSDNDDEEQHGWNSNNWYKRKRSLRAKVENCRPSSEEIDLANCLMMLSNAIVNHPSEASPEESCASASRDDEFRNGMILPLSFAAPEKVKVPAAVPKGMFECKACKKVFTSHQALGGHRASHKKVKGCFAAKLDFEDDRSGTINNQLFPMVKSTAPMQNLINRGAVMSNSPSKRKHRGHECSICHRVFSSGQALGGHKRCHWITSNSPISAANAVSPVKKLFEDSDLQPALLDLTLDLNLPASDDRAAIVPWLGMDHKQKNENNNNRIHKNRNKSDNEYRENEAVDEVAAERKAKVARLSELKDMDMKEGESSSWLQVGIGTENKAAPES